MNVLVIGGNGFIGSNLVDLLLIENHSVRVFDKYLGGDRKSNDQVEYIVGDFGNRGLLNSALDGIDIVYHLVSTSVPKTSNDDPAYDVMSNVVETIHLLEQCVKKQIQKIVFTSSGGTVYGRPQYLPVPETAMTDPECSYGIVKLAIEKYLALFNHIYGLNYIVIRPSNPFGPRQNAEGIQGVISVFMRKMMRGETVTIWGDGSVVRDYIYISDLVNAIYIASMTNTNSKIYNIGSGEGKSINQIVEILRDVTSMPGNVEYLNSRQFDIPEIILDISKAVNELMWRPQISIIEGIRMTYEYMKQQV